MAVPVGAIAKKVAGDLIFNTEETVNKTIKIGAISISVPLVVLLLIFAIPAMFIISIPSVLFGSGDTNQKYIAMYQQAVVDINTENTKWIDERQSSGCEVNNNCTLTWQELMAIDTVLFTQDFSKTSMQHINGLAEKFIERKVSSTSYTTQEKYTDEKGKTQTRTVTKTVSIITISTRSFSDVLDMLGMDKDQKAIARNVYETLLSIYGETGDTGDGISSEIPLFHQWDSRWGYKPYGSHGTIASSGCGPTSAAMVITGLQGNLGNLDENHDGILDPAEAADYSVAHGFRCEDGTDWGYFASIGRATGLNVRQYSVSQYQQVYNELKAGHPVIASMGPGHFTSGGHFIVLVSVLPNGKIKVNDPNRQECSDTPWDFNSIIVAEALQFWAFDNPNRKSAQYVATAYTGAANEGGGKGVTANGTHIFGKDLRNKYIAVDPTKIKLGSRVLIEVPASVRYQTMPDGTVVDMDGYYTAVDTGSAIQGSIIDIYFGTGDAYIKLCNQFGRQNINIYIK